MEDESYELVRKGFIDELKKENSKLREEIELLKKAKVLPENKIDYDEITSRILLNLDETNDKLYFKIKKDLDYLKNINEKNLTNILSSTDDLENKLDETINSMNKMIMLLNKSIQKIETNKKDETESNMKIINNDLLEIKAYLGNLNDFMNKLSFLLSQINPSNLK